MNQELSWALYGWQNANNSNECVVHVLVVINLWLPLLFCAPYPWYPCLPQTSGHHTRGVWSEGRSEERTFSKRLQILSVTCVILPPPLPPSLPIPLQQMLFQQHSREALEVEVESLKKQIDFRDEFLDVRQCMVWLLRRAR